jgi:hypothetical protein
MEEQAQQQKLPTTADELNDLMDHLQSYYRGDDARVTAALCIGLMVHLRTCLFADFNLKMVEESVDYLNRSLHAMIMEWKDSTEAKRRLN